MAEGYFVIFSRNYLHWAHAIADDLCYNKNKKSDNMKMTKLVQYGGGVVKKGTLLSVPLDVHMTKLNKYLFFILILLFIFSYSLSVFGFEVAFQQNHFSPLDNLTQPQKLDLRKGKPEVELDLFSDNLILPEFNVRGIYVTGWVAGVEDRFNSLIELVDKTILNSMVIDVKDDQGYISYQTGVKLAREIGAERNKIRNIRALLTRLHSKGIYTIARIVVFKDPLLARQKPDLAMGLWSSINQEATISKNWVDPAETEVWNYNIELAREALGLGFDEVQFDYIRYPAMANNPLQAIMGANITKSEQIIGFATTARRELKKFGKPISIDVFGLTTSVEDDMGIGQNFRELSKHIQIISPMVYPSHYAPGSFGVEIPDKEPYKIIYKSMVDAQRKVQTGKDVIIRPWLQDFSLKHKYSARDVQEQIKALSELGIEEWLLWNPRSYYTEEALKNLSY